MAYLLVFRGELAPGVSRKQAAKAIAEKLGKNAKLIEKTLFIGKPVKVDEVDSKERALYYVDIFKEAGAKLEVRTPRSEKTAEITADKPAPEKAAAAEPPKPEAVAVAPAEGDPELTAPINKAPPAEVVPALEAVAAVASEREAAEPPSASKAKKVGAKKSGGGLRIGFAIAATLVLAVLGAAAWYTMPVWMPGSVSEDQATASNALATQDVVGLGHLDVNRALTLQSRIHGSPDPDALLSDNDTWDSLVAAGIDPATQIDDAVFAMYADTDDPAAEATWAVVLTGSMESGDVRDWLTDRYDVDNFDMETATVYFSWLDEKTCEPVTMKAARIGPSRVLLADADRVEELWARLEAGAPAEVAIDDWLGMTSEQLLTVGIMNTAGLGQAAGGMAGMMLAGASQATQPAEALYFGVAPTLMPPGVVISGAVTSDSQPFLQLAHTGATAWHTEVKTDMADRPDILDIVNRISFTLEDRTFRVGIQFDTNVDEELQTLISGMMEGSGFSPGGAAGHVPDEQVEENPATYGSIATVAFRPYDEFGSSFFQPQWQDGPFAVGVASLGFEDDELRIELRGEGRGLPNLGSRAKLVRMKVTDVTDDRGDSLLPLRQCGPASAGEWTESGHVSRGSYYEDDEIAYYQSVGFDKTLALADGSSADDVASIAGVIEFHMPVEVISAKLPMPIDGQVVETEDLRIVFQGDSPHTISYQLSGDKNHLLDVRGLNAAGQVLSSGSSVSSENWFGSTKNVSIDVLGTIATVEVVVAERLKPMQFTFDVPSAFPAVDDDFSTPSLPFELAEARKVAAAMRLDAPAPTFEWNAPVGRAEAGPVFVAVQQLQASTFMGLTTRVDVYVSDEMPLLDHLNGGTVVLDQAELTDGTKVALALSGPVGLKNDGGYWSNGEFVADPDKPWLKGGTDMQMVDYEAEAPVAIEGRIVFRAPVDTVSSEISAMPGSRLDEAGVELVVNEWRPNNIAVGIARGAERILAIEALDADGSPVGRADRIGGSSEDREARIGKLTAHPHTLRVLLATESAEHEVPFTVSVESGESTAGL